MKKKIFIIFCILLLNLTLLSGCYDSRGIEDLAYVTAIGLDISENNLLYLTMQISIPSSGSSSGSESGSSQSSKANEITVECTSINTGLALANSYISKELDLSHCKVIIISEMLAKSGISSYVDTLANNIEIRPDCNIIITKCDAKDFIENAKPSIEALTARYYEVSINSSKYTGYTPSTELIEFIGNMKNTTIQASAILGGLNTNIENSSSISANSDNNYVAR
jgi:spore germination protein KC